MVFNSYTFALFFVVVLTLYRVARHRQQNALLLVASYAFYAAWDWRFLSLILISTAVDYGVGRRLQHAEGPSRARWLALSVITNLGLLGVFKYFNFFAESLSALLSTTGLTALGGHLEIVLPVGISFYTFQTLSYTIDVYRGKLEPTRDPLDFALFVAFFPQLVAGPIERASSLLPQLSSPRTVTENQKISGVWLIFWGLFKKAVIADNLGLYVDEVYGAEGIVSGGQVLFATYAFALQIYCDFSGYSDMARGLAKLLGIELMVNFNLPYLAQSPTELWRRWHISLSTWLRDYLYIPLGGNRGGRWKTYRNLMLTMLLGGLWHGAAWNFVLWGAYHGLLLAAHRLISERRRTPPRAGGWRSVLAVIFTFHLTCLGWLFFRAETLAQIGSLLKSLFTPWTVTEPLVPLATALVVFGGLLWAVEAWIRNADDPRTRPHWNTLLGPLAVGILLVLLFGLASPSQRQFIYFQF